MTAYDTTVPGLIRSAAKNFSSVSELADSGTIRSHYRMVLDELLLPSDTEPSPKVQWKFFHLAFGTLYALSTYDGLGV